MKNHKQLLMDFYLELLKIPHASEFRMSHQNLYSTVLIALAYELRENREIIQHIFERMAAEDGR